jgi:hypothetical protein
MHQYAWAKRENANLNSTISKFEYRNPKQIQITKKAGLPFEISGSQLAG